MKLENISECADLQLHEHVFHSSRCPYEKLERQGLPAPPPCYDQYVSSCQQTASRGRRRPEINPKLIAKTSPVEHAVFFQSRSQPTEYTTRTPTRCSASMSSQRATSLAHVSQAAATAVTQPILSMSDMFSTAGEVSISEEKRQRPLQQVPSAGISPNLRKRRFNPSFQTTAVVDLTLNGADSDINLTELDWAGSVANGDACSLKPRMRTSASLTQRAGFLPCECHASSLHASDAASAQSASCDEVPSLWATPLGSGGSQFPLPVAVSTRPVRPSPIAGASWEAPRQSQRRSVVTVAPRCSAHTPFVVVVPSQPSSLTFCRSGLAPRRDAQAFTAPQGPLVDVLCRRGDEHCATVDFTAASDERALRKELLNIAGPQPHPSNVNFRALHTRLQSSSGEPLLNCDRALRAGKQRSRLPFPEAIVRNTTAMKAMRQGRVSGEHMIESNGFQSDLSTQDARSPETANTIACSAVRGVASSLDVDYASTRGFSCYSRNTIVADSNALLTAPLRELPLIDSLSTYQRSRSECTRPQPSKPRGRRGIPSVAESLRTLAAHGTGRSRKSEVVMRLGGIDDTSRRYSLQDGLLESSKWEAVRTAAPPWVPTVRGSGIPHSSSSKKGTDGDPLHEGASGAHGSAWKPNLAHEKLFAHVKTVGAAVASSSNDAQRLMGSLVDVSNAIEMAECANATSEGQRPRAFAKHPRSWETTEMNLSFVCDSPDTATPHRAAAGGAQMDIALRSPPSPMDIIVPLDSVISLDAGIEPLVESSPPQWSSPSGLPSSHLLSPTAMGTLSSDRETESAILITAERVRGALQRKSHGVFPDRCRSPALLSQSQSFFTSSRAIEEWCPFVHDNIVDAPLNACMSSLSDCSDVVDPLQLLQEEGSSCDGVLYDVFGDDVDTDAGGYCLSLASFAYRSLWVSSAIKPTEEASHPSSPCASLQQLVTDDAAERLSAEKNGSLEALKTYEGATATLCGRAHDEPPAEEGSTDLGGVTPLSEASYDSMSAPFVESGNPPVVSSVHTMEALWRDPDAPPLAKSAAPVRAGT